jgi:tetratricopeptide (TPR) repeat protein
MGNALKINWKKVADGKLYVVKVMNSFDEIIFSKETNDTSYTILIDQLPLNNETSFICQVGLKDNSKKPSDKRQIKLIKNDKATELSEEIIEINANLADDNSINNFMKANFYKEKGLFMEAADCYQKAIKADPEVTDYVESYDALLEANGLQNYKINKKK